VENNHVIKVNKHKIIYESFALMIYSCRN